MKTISPRQTVCNIPTNDPKDPYCGGKLKRITELDAAAKKSAGAGKEILGSELPAGDKIICPTGACPTQQATRSPALLFQAEVPILDLHRWADVYLHTDQSFEGSIGRVVVDYDAHQMIVEDVHQHVSANDQVHGNPIGGEELRQILCFSER